VPGFVNVEDALDVVDDLVACRPRGLVNDDQRFFM
jgi:hypothetical protein